MFLTTLIHQWHTLTAMKLRYILPFPMRLSYLHADHCSVHALNLKEGRLQCDVFCCSRAAATAVSAGTVARKPNPSYSPCPHPGTKAVCLERDSNGTKIIANSKSLRLNWMSPDCFIEYSTATFLAQRKSEQKHNGVNCPVWLNSRKHI